MQLDVNIHIFFSKEFSHMSEIQPTQERSIAARIFISPDEPRLRAGWRLLLQIILLFIFGIIISILAGFIGFLDESLTSLLNQILSFFVIIGSVFFDLRWLDKPFFDLCVFTCNSLSIFLYL